MQEDELKKYWREKLEKTNASEAGENKDVTAPSNLKLEQNPDITEITKQYFDNLKLALDTIQLDDIQKIANVLFDAYKNNKKVFILGNGGAAATASHMACDLGKGTLKNVYDHNEKRFQVLSLTDNVATMTAFANDLGYDDMFVQQLRNYIQPGDIVIGISGSGNTPNVIKALLYAKQVGATTIGFLGFTTGGSAKDLVDYDITIKSNNYGVIEDLHTVLDHLLTTCISYMKGLYDSNKSKEPVEWKERSTRR